MALWDYSSANRFDSGSWKLFISSPKTKKSMDATKNELKNVFKKTQDWNWTLNFKKVRSEVNVSNISPQNQLLWQQSGKYYDCNIFVPNNKDKLKLWWYKAKITDIEPDVYYIESAESIRNISESSRNKKDTSYHSMSNKLRWFLGWKFQDEKEKNLRNRSNNSETIDYLILTKLILSAHIAGTNRVVFSNFKNCPLLTNNINIIKRLIAKWWIKKWFIQQHSKHSLELILDTEKIKEFMNKPSNPGFMENPAFVETKVFSWRTH